MLRGTLRSSLRALSRPSPRMFCGVGSSLASVGEGELTRDFLAVSSQEYYKRKFDSLPRIDFRALDNKAAYAALQEKLVKDTPNVIATAVEQFSPFYAEAVAHWMVRDHLASKTTEPLTVLEIGGGTGRGASDILGFVRTKYPAVYASMRYHIVEVSVQLADKQKELLTQEGHKNFEIIQMDILKWNSTRFVDQHVYILALEVLDNLPHDKVVRTDESVRQTHIFSKTESALEAEEVEDEEADQQQPAKDTLKYCEASQLLSDPLIEECLRMFDEHPVEEHSYTNFSRNGLIGSNAVTSNPYVRRFFEWFKEETKETYFLPTGALQLMKIMKSYFPRNSFLAADFEYITELTTGHFAPVMSINRSPYRDKSLDVLSHLAGSGQVDIYHSVSFPLLKHMYDNVALSGDTSSELIPQDEFLFIWARTAESCVKTGFSPMMMDYAKRMLVRGRAKAKPEAPSDSMSNVS